MFQEQVIGAADVGTTWLFEFDAKRGNIEEPTQAVAFIKTLNPFAGFSLSRFETTDMTNVPVTWGRYSVELEITPDLVGHIFQIGFFSTTTAYKGSGVFYDNINLDLAPVDVGVDVKPASCPNPLNVRMTGALPVAITGSADLDVSTIDPASLRLAGVAPFRSGYDDDAAHYEPITGKEDCLYDCTELEEDGWTDLVLKFDAEEVLAALGAVDHRQCVVVELTGNFYEEYGGGRLRGSDVVVIIDRGSGTGGPPAASPNLNVMPSFSGF